MLLAADASVPVVVLEDFRSCTRMTVSVIVRCQCDASLARPGSRIKKKCGKHAEFEAANIVKAKWAAEEAGWRFLTHQNPDKCLCPECGPEIVAYQYGSRK